MKEFKIILTVLVIGLFACKKNKGQDPPPPPPPLPHQEPAIYMNGGTFTNNTPTYQVFPRYFKNGRDTVYRDINGVQIHGRVWINNDTICVLGAVKVNNVNVYTIWKNGVPYTLPNITPGVEIPDWYVSGSDIYLLYYEQVAGGHSTKLWKNGIVTTLVTDTYTVPRRLIVSGTDVYVFGQYLEIGNYKIRIWKNGVLTDINSTANNQVTSSGYAVNNGDVYIAGQQVSSIGYRATIWKNGVPTYLTNGTYQARALDVAISGSDVYVVGYEGNSIYPGPNRTVAKMWKNGVPTVLTNGVFNATAEKILLIGPDVYIAGNEENQQPNINIIYTSSILKVWKNGTPTSYTDGTNKSTVYQFSYF